jgi:hypothetical protein
MSFAPFGQYTGLRGQQRDEEEFIKHQKKKMKYYTTNFFESGIKDVTGNDFHDGFGTPSQEIDRSTSLRGQITNPKIKHEWGALPINSAGLSRAGPTIDHYIERDRKSCNPEDSQFYKRSFYTLDVNPNAVQKSDSYRGGVDTRNDTRGDYL